MAGIGFVLRKLARKDDIFSVIQAYFHSALISTGPWLFTVLAIGITVSVCGQFSTNEALLEFRLVIMYNFAFSFVLSGPIYMAVTRYLSDCIYQRQLEGASGLLLGALAFMFAVQLPLVIYFYFFYAHFSFGIALSATANFLIITGIWLIGVFLSAIKDYTVITRTFAVGLLLAVVASIKLGNLYGTAGMLNGFSLGLAIIMFIMIGAVLAQYPFPFQKPLAFLSYFKKCWELPLGAFFFNLGAWVDKWIMWTAPEAERVASTNLVIYSNYDSAMFIAYMSIIPAIAAFILSVETNFFEKYLRFYSEIQGQATYAKIVENHKKIIGAILSSSRNLIILQGSISLAIILAASQIFDWLGVNYLQLGIFRLGVLGALFHVLILFITIFLSYFDSRKRMLLVQVIFFATNASFTFISMKMGFIYYGYGYFLASLVTFVIAAVVVADYIYRLPYHAMVTSNTAVN